MSVIYGARMKVDRQADGGLLLEERRVRDKWTLLRAVTVSEAIRLTNTRGDNRA